MKFTLQKSSGSNHSVSKFDIFDSHDAMCGRICVPIEEEGDLLAHWQDTPRSASASQPVRGKQNGLVSEMLAAGQRSKAAAPAPATSSGTSKRDPMISAMVAAAKKHPLNRAAILRGC